MSGERLYTDVEKFVSLKGAYDWPPAMAEGQRGKGVFIGIVDSGVNILHPAFLTTDAPRRTRIEWLRIKETVANAVTEFDSVKINQILDKVAQKKTVQTALLELGWAPDAASAKKVANRLLDLDRYTSGHGTKVASVAAATPWRRFPKSKLYGGVAADARLIVFAGLDAASGVPFCFEKAGDTPCVVNVSLATSEVSHSGRHVFGNRVDELVNAKPGRAVVVAAGNEGARHKHARVTAPDELFIHIIDKNLKNFTVFVTSAGSVELTIKNESEPIYRMSGPDNLGHTTRIEQFASLPGDEMFVHQRVTIDASTRPARRKKVVDPGPWRLRIRGSPAVTHVWVVTDNPEGVDDLRISPKGRADLSREDDWMTDTDLESPDWQRPKTWVQYSLNGYATARSVIAVGGIAIVASNAPGGLSGTDYLTSSRGPTIDDGRDARYTKPDIAAPGESIRVAYWVRSSKIASGVSTASDVEGTSVAAPLVTGAIALALAREPALNHESIRAALRKKFVPGTFPAQDGGAKEFEPGYQSMIQAKDINVPDLVGAGLLDIMGLIQQVTP